MPISPCDGVYDSSDYVYLSNEKTPVFYEDLLKTIHEIENTLEETFTNDCINTTEEMMCHYFFPSCGNSTVFEFPTSVCPSDCEEQRHKCPSQWTWFEQKLPIHQLNCSATKLPHLCTSMEQGKPSATESECFINKVILSLF